jgi:uncharacterized protein (DUF1778 family)
MQIGLFPERIGVRIAPETKQAAMEAAKARGLTLSDWLRVVVEQAAAEHYPPRRRARLPHRPGTTTCRPT